MNEFSGLESGKELNYPGKSFGFKFIPNQSDFFPNHSGICIRTKTFHSDLIQRNFPIRMNPVNPNETEFFVIIRIDSDRPDSFGLKV